MSAVKLILPASAAWASSRLANVLLEATSKRVRAVGAAALLRSACPNRVSLLHEANKQAHVGVFLDKGRPQLAYFLGGGR
jgi:hypothetical protein